MKINHCTIAHKYRYDARFADPSISTAEFLLHFGLLKVGDKDKINL